MQLFPKLHSNPCDYLLITFVIQLVVAVNMTVSIGYGLLSNEAHCENLVVGGNVIDALKSFFSCCTVYY